MTHVGREVSSYRREYVVPGNSFKRQYVCKTGDAVFDLTGYVVRWTAYYGDRKIEKSTALNSMYMPDPTTGAVLLSLPPDETRKVPVNDAMRYQFELISPEGAQLTPLYGDLVGLTEGHNLD